MTKAFNIFRILKDYFSRILLFLIIVSFSPSLNSQIYNVNFDDMNFGGSGVTITAKIGDGTNVGDAVLYEDIVTVGGQSIDGIIRTISLSNGSFTTYDYTGASYNNLERWFSPQLTFDSGGGYVEFRVEFILGGSYNNGTNTGTDITLQNLVVNSYDIDGNGNSGSNQYCDFSEFSTSELGNPTNLEYAYDPVTGLTRYRSTLNTNTSNAADEKNRVRWNYGFASSLELKLGGEGDGAAYYFLDFSEGAAYSASTLLESPILDLDTYTAGVDHDTTYTGTQVSFTDGDTNIIYSGSSIDNLKISFLTAMILEGSDEKLLFNGAGGMQILLDFVDAQSISDFTIGGITYSVAASVSGGRSELVFTKSGGGVINLSDAESMLDSIDYRNYNSTPTIATRTFNVTVQDGAFESGISDFNIVYSMSLPIDLAYFEVINDGQGVLLNWETVFESNTSHFGIERSNNGISWEEIGTILGTGTSNSSNDYKFLDDSPLVGANYYRLNWYDNDGDSWISDSRSVGVTSDKIKFIAVTNSKKVTLVLPDIWQGEIMLFEASGNTTMSVIIDKSDSRVQTFNLEGSDLLRCWLQCISDQNEVNIYSFIQ